MFSRGQWVDKKDAGLARVSTHIHLHKDLWVKLGDLIKWRASRSRPPPDSTTAVEHQMFAALASFGLHFHHLAKMIQSDIFAHMKNSIFSDLFWAIFKCGHPN